MKRKQIIAFMMTLALMCTGLTACGSKTAMDKLSGDTQVAVSEADTTEEKATEEKATEEGTTKEEATEEKATEEDTTKEDTTAEANASEYMVEYFEEDFNEETAEAAACLKITNKNDNTSWVYKSKVKPIGQFVGVTYLLADKVIYIVDDCDLHVYDLATQKEIASAELPSYAGGGMVLDEGCLYTQPADQGLVVKLDQNLNVVWAKELVAGGGYELKVEGDVLHCFYEYGDIGQYDLDKNTGEVIKKIERTEY